MFFLFCFSQILLLHTIAFCFRPGRPALFDFVRFDFFMCAALFFSRRSRRGRAVNRADSSALHPSVFLFVFLRAALLFRHISTPSHFFLLRLQTPLNSIFPTPFYFSATSSFLFSLPSFFPSRQATLSTPPPPPPHPTLSPSVFSVCSFTVGPTTEPPGLRLDATSQLTLAGRHARSPGTICCFSMLKCQCIGSALNKPLRGSKVQWSRPPRMDPMKYS